MRKVIFCISSVHHITSVLFFDAVFFRCGKDRRTVGDNDLVELGCCNIIPSASLTDLTFYYINVLFPSSKSEWIL